MSENPLLELEGKVFAGGKQSRNYFSKQFGINNLKGYRVQAASWTRHTVEIQIVWSDEQDTVFCIEEKRDDAEGLLVTNFLVVFYRGQDIPRELAETAFRTGQQTFRNLTLKDLAFIFASDPEKGTPGLPMPPGVDESKQSESLLDTWGADDSFADFFASGEISRSQLDSIDFSRLFFTVQHCDNECNFVNPIGDDLPFIWLNNFPWLNRIRNNRRPDDFSEDIRHDPESDQMLTSNLNEHDVIMGNVEKTRKIIQKACTIAQKYNKQIFFSNTCVPVVTGEDVESEIQKAREKYDVDILYLTTTSDSMINVFQDILVNKRLKSEKEKHEKKSKSINLIGFPKRKDVAELLGTLTTIGVQLNSILLPTLNYQIIDNYVQGELSVFYPNATWQHLYDQLLISTEIPHIVPKSPYGMVASKLWLDTIVEALSMDVELGEKWNAHYRSTYEEINHLKKKSAQYSIGIVIRSTELFYLTQPSKTWGIPVLELLGEMGFGVELFVMSSSLSDITELESKLPALCSITIDSFSTREELSSKLLHSNCAAILSYHFYDWRITQAGKNNLSLQIFEMGPEGFLRSFKRLINICSTSFYSKYSKYLSRNQAGLRR